MAPALSHLVVLFASFFFASFIQQVSGQTNILTSSNQCCSTLVGSKSVNPVPSSTCEQVIHLQKTVYSTITPVVTKIPPASTATSTSIVSSITIVTASQKTITSLTTNVFTSQSTISTTLTYTIDAGTTVVETRTVAGTTIPAAPGFTPIALSPVVIAAGGGAKAKRDPPGRLLSDHKHAKRNQPVIHPLPRIHGLAVDVNARRAAAAKSSPGPFPTKVICSRTVSLITVTTKLATVAALTVTAPTPIVRTTIVTTSLSTTTAYPIDATIISTIFETTASVATIRFYETTTTTPTITTTIYKPDATVYAVCEDPNNFISSVGGQALFDLGVSTDSVDFPDASSAYDCCNICQARSDCGASYFDDVGCILVTGVTTCDPTQSIAELEVISIFPIEAMASNSNCGQYGYVHVFAA